MPGAALLFVAAYVAFQLQWPVLAAGFALVGLAVLGALALRTAWTRSRRGP